MKEHGLIRFVMMFSYENDRIKEKYYEELEELFDDVVDDIFDTRFDYWTKCSNEAQPEVLYFNEKDELMMECSLMWIDSHCCETTGETETFDEEEILNCVDSPITLNQILLNIQNKKFHKMNDLIAA